MTDRMLAVLRVLAAHEYEYLPPSKIAMKMDDLPTEIIYSRRSGAKAGSGTRVMNQAQRIISALTSLHRQGLIEYGRRPDGLSGSAYGITDKGLAALEEAKVA